MAQLSPLWGAWLGWTLRGAAAAVVAALTPLAALLVSLCVGSYPITPAQVLSVLVSQLYHTMGFPCVLKVDPVHEVVVMQIRLPRVLMAMLVGAALSASGVALQAVFRNPLVDSYILGISAGAAFGASLAVVLELDVGVTPIAFAFSLAAVGLACLLARASGDTSPVTLVLAGILVNALFTAATSLLKFLVEPEKLAAIVYWIMGSFANADWAALTSSAPLIVACCALMWAMRWHLNVVSFGEEARTLGVDVAKVRMAFIALSALATSASVAYCGIIGWVGLIVPHACRMAFGPDHRRLLPLAMALGSALTVVADDVARSVATYEIPVGVLTTLLGAPFFGYLLVSRGGRHWQA